MPLCGIGQAANAIDGNDFVTWVSALPESKPGRSALGAERTRSPSAFGSGSAHDESMEGSAPETMPRGSLPRGASSVRRFAIRGAKCRGPLCGNGRPANAMHAPNP